MKKILFTILGMLAVTMAANAQVSITKVDRIEPTDGVYMDMATEAAKASVNEGGVANGAVIILNNAFRSSGKGIDAEAQALSKSRLNSLSNAKLYTVNEPATATVIEYSKRGVQAIYFVNPKDAVVAAGIHQASEYEPMEVEEGIEIAPVLQMTYGPAMELVTK